MASIPSNYVSKADLSTLSDAELDAKIAQNLANLSTIQYQQAANLASQNLQSKLAQLGAAQTTAAAAAQYHSVWTKGSTVMDYGYNNTATAPTRTLEYPLANDGPLKFTATDGTTIYFDVDTRTWKTHTKLMEKVDKVFDKLHKQVVKDLGFSLVPISA